MVTIQTWSQTACILPSLDLVFLTYVMVIIIVVATEGCCENYKRESLTIVIVDMVVDAVVIHLLIVDLSKLLLSC